MAGITDKIEESGTHSSEDSGGEKPKEQIDDTAHAAEVASGSGASASGTGTYKIPKTDKAIAAKKAADELKKKKEADDARKKKNAEDAKKKKEAQDAKKLKSVELADAGRSSKKSSRSKHSSRSPVVVSSSERSASESDDKKRDKSPIRKSKSKKKKGSKNKKQLPDSSSSSSEEEDKKKARSSKKKKKHRSRSSSRESRPKKKSKSTGKESSSSRKRKESSSSESSDEDAVYVGGKNVDKKLKEGAQESAANPDWVFLSERQLASKRLGFHTKLQARDTGNSDMHVILKQILQDASSVRETEQDICRTMATMKTKKKNRDDLRRMLTSLYANISTLEFLCGYIDLAFDHSFGFVAEFALTDSRHMLPSDALQRFRALKKDRLENPGIRGRGAGSFRASKGRGGRGGASSRGRGGATSNPTTDGSCHRCHEKGHYARDCPKNK